MGLTPSLHCAGSAAKTKPWPAGDPGKRAVEKKDIFDFSLRQGAGTTLSTLISMGRLTEPRSATDDAMCTRDCNEKFTVRVPDSWWHLHSRLRRSEPRDVRSLCANLPC